MRALRRVPFLGAAALIACAAGTARSDVLRDAAAAKRRLQYDAAAAALDAALPDLRGDIRTRALLLRATVTTDAGDARRFLLDAERSASAPGLRQQANLELGRLEYARGNYRSVRTRLGPLGGDPECALLLAQTAAGLGDAARIDSTLAPAGDGDWAQALRGWGALQRGAPRAALDVLGPLAGRTGSDALPTILLWKTEAEAKLGLAAVAARTAADLRSRFPSAPEAAAADRAARLPPVNPPDGTAPAERFTLQIASFEDRANALRLRDNLRGVPGVRMEDVDVRGKHVYRISAGDFPTREAAEEFARTHLAPRGAAAQVVRWENVRP